MKRAYALFYLQGREDRLLKADIDTEEIAEQVLDGKGTVHELLRKAVVIAAEPLRVDRKKRAWMEDYADEIKEAGGDGEEAYRHYVDGKIDELVYSLEPDVVDLMGDEEDEDEDGEDDGDGDDGDDDDGEGAP